jgi:hypothetical protein
MTKIEKYMIAISAVCLVGMAVSVSALYDAIEKEGGVKSSIISAGKEVKEIAIEIRKD